MRLRIIALLAILLLCIYFRGYTQDSALHEKLCSLPGRLFNKLNKTSQYLTNKLNGQTERYLAQLEKHEKKMRQELLKKDPVAAKAIFGNIHAYYNSLQQLSTSQNIYSAHLDSMQTVVRFLQQNASTQLSSIDENFKSTISSYQQLQNKLNYTAAIKRQLKERQQYLRQQLQQPGLVKELKKFQKDIYYYQAKIDAYKRLLDDPSKLEASLLHLASKIPAFKEFFSKNSMLSSMFRLPGNDPVASAAPIPGLQTRAYMQQELLQRFGNAPDASRAMQQNIQSAQAQINQLKEKISKLGGGSSDVEMPDFKPNSQKIKSFWNRIELGANVQSLKNNNYFPVTSDIALSAGYKLNDKSIAGIGVSCKLGWGESIRHIRVTHEGFGLRSFFDWKLKGSFYASGGFEYNYQQPFTQIRQLNKVNNWQQSGLVGVSKVVAVQSKLFKKTKVQLLWDFLSYQQVPHAQPIKFRIGYNLK